MVDIQDVKKFWDSRPCNIRHSNLPVGSIEYFNEVEARKYFIEPHIPEFADFSSWRGNSVLEIGAGIGTDAVNFVRAGALYTGIEISEESLNLARKRFEVFGLSGELDFANAENCTKVLSGRTFDLIYSFGVLHHTPNIELALAEIRKLSHEKTRLKIMVYAKDSYKDILIRGGFDQPEAQNGCPIANTYSKEEITALLNSAGFSILEIRKDHLFKYNIEKYINYQYEFEPWFNAMPKDLLSLLEKNLGWHMLIDASISR